MKKVLLILVDGMRPDALTGIDFVESMKKTSAWSLDVKTVSPSNTLACHMSLFHSIPPSRHGMDNFYIPMAQPVNGIFEQNSAHGLKNAFFYSWEALRSLSRAELDPVAYATFISGRRFGYERTTAELADHALTCIREKAPEFVFLYFGWTDYVGHTNGWMSAPYLAAVRGAWAQIERVMAAVGDEYTVLITADHGGHGGGHGTTLPEDMTIPLFLHGDRFQAGQEFHGASIMDIAPTIAALLEIPPVPEWEGKSLV